MHTAKYGTYIIGVGAFIVVASLLIDLVGLGEGGIQSAQLLGILSGVLTAVIGWGVLLAERDSRFEPWAAVRVWFESAGSWPTTAWIVAGFLIVYVGLFLAPVFFNPEHDVRYFNRFPPEAAPPIGRDLRFNTDSIRNWLVDGNGLYDFENHYYPPLYAVVFAPTLLLSYPANYYLISALTLASALLVLLALPRWTRAGSSALFLFFFLTTLSSYGTWFELERGQFNLLTLALVMLAVYLFHFQDEFRYLAYLLFSVAVHIKLYPAIFVLLFVRDWRDWKGNLQRLAGLGALNLALLFVLGFEVFRDFLSAIPRLMGALWVRPYNHSVKSFVYGLADPASGLGESLESFLPWIEAALMAFFFLCLLSILVRAYQRNAAGIDYDLMLACTIGALVIPSVSIDYKLPLIAAPLALSLSARGVPGAGPQKWLAAALLVLIGAAYSVTLFPFFDRPAYLANSLPMLLIILGGVTLLNRFEVGAAAAA